MLTGYCDNSKLIVPLNLTHFPPLRVSVEINLLLQPVNTKVYNFYYFSWMIFNTYNMEKNKAQFIGIIICDDS